MMSFSLGLGIVCALCCLLAKPWAAAEDAGVCRLPCLPCANNGSCNGLLARQHTDGQYFGSCVCPAGYSGVQCEVHSTTDACLDTCHHRSTCVGTTCQCTQHYTGINCMQPLCFNQPSGVGPQLVTSANTTGLCAEPCVEGFEGGENTYCRYPTSEKGCSQGLWYSESTLGVESQLSMTCTSPDPAWWALLAGDTHMVADCSKPSGWNDTSLRDGKCRFEFHRYSFTSAIMEELFYCEMSSCIVSPYRSGGATLGFYSVGETGNVFQEKPGAAALRWLLFLTALGVGVLVLFRFRFKSAAVLTGLGLTALLLILNIAVAATVNESANKLNTTVNFESDEGDVMTELICLSTELCYCNKESKAEPNCNVPQFEEMVGALKTRSVLTCNNRTKQCRFNHDDLLGGTFDITLECHARDCTDSTALIGEIEQRIEAEEGSVAAVAIVCTLIGLLVIAVCVSVIVHVLRTADAKKRWEELANDATLPFPEEGDASHQANGAVLKQTATNEAWVRRQPFALFAKNIAYRVEVEGGKKEREVLKEVSVRFTAGNMYAILGPSGCGKTSLLDIICAREKPGKISGGVSIINCSSEGAVFDTPVNSKNQDSFRRMLSYVADDDAILPSLTVEEALAYAADLRQPVFISKEEKKHFVLSMVETFQLSDCRQTVIGKNLANDENRGGLSQGERRRVAIALHMIALPRLLILDEPTTGLDSYNARLVIKCLHAASRALGHRLSPRNAEETTAVSMPSYHPQFYNYVPVVVMTIHQPSSDMLSMFDEVLLISKGRCVYTGPPSGDELSRWLERTVALNQEHCQQQQRENGDTGNEKMKPATLEAQDQGLSTADYLVEVAFKISEGTLDILSEVNHRSCEERVAAMTASCCSGAAQQDSPSSPGGTQEAGSSSPTRGNANAAGSPTVNGNCFKKVEEQRQFYPLFWTQCSILLRRGWNHILGSGNAIAVHFLISSIMTMLVSFVYVNSDKDIPGTLNKAGAVTFYLLWISIVNLSSLEIFLSERGTYVFERNSACYSPLAYFTTKILLDFCLLRIIPTLIGGCLLYFPIGFRATVHSFGMFLLITLLFSIASAGISATVATLVPNFGVGMLINGFVIVLFFVFGGFISQADIVPDALGWIRYLSPFYYAFESLMINDLKEQMCFFAPRDAAGNPTSVSIPLQCEQYLFNLGIYPKNFDFDVSMLGVWSLVYLVLSFVFLVLFVRGKR